MLDGMGSPFDGFGSPFGRKRSGAAAADPVADLLALLSPSAAQLIYHPLVRGGMFQDRAGTTPWTTSGQLLGRVNDIGGGGYHATAISDAARAPVYESGGFIWVETNGVNHAYETAALAAPGVDKVQVFAGVRKNLAGTSIIAELSPSADSNTHSFALLNNAAANAFRFSSRGDGTLRNATGPAQTPPITSTASGFGNIGAPSSTLFLNGAQSAETLSSQGAGNYNPSGTYRLNYGARAGSSDFFSGYFYGALPIARFGPTLAAGTITDAEAIITGWTDL